MHIKSICVIFVVEISERYFVCKRAEKSIQNFNDNIFVEKIKIVALKFKKGFPSFPATAGKGERGCSKGDEERKWPQTPNLCYNVIHNNF